QLIQAIPTRPLLAGEAGIRLSLAGAQNKLPIRYRNGQVSLPYGRAASTHIIKPAITHYESSVMNEWFCMRLAKLMDLPVPDVLIIGTETPVYCVERYDRIIVTDEHVERLHQEDFCQALGVAADVKYEKEGGPSLRDCFGLIRSASIQPAKDLNTALKWVVFNYLIGNADAHAKNIALLLTQQGPRLAPFYDLMCTAIYEGLSDRLAMKIGNEDRPDWVIERRWNDMANDLEIDYKLVRRLLAAMSHKITNVAAQLQDHCSSRYGSRDTIVQINKVIAQRVTKVMRILEISE
ncbi:MAG: type II toxin-antitoxin system HipA family toxin, partial [Gammaproteobacteria bacterium]|nr:type II toxin-antitoxin system HipA family toxin [Gammaproteobacteria bacterium]